MTVRSNDLFHARLIRRLVLCLLLCATIIGLNFTATPTLAQTPDATTKVDRAVLRTGPSRRYEAIRELPIGTELTVTGRNNDANWLYVTLADSAQGWLALQLLSIRRNFSIINLPVVQPGAPASAGTDPNAQPTQPAADNSSNPSAPPAADVPAPIAGSGVAGGFEIGGQVQGLGASTVAAMQRAGMKWVKFQAFAGDGAAVGGVNAAHGNGLKVLFSVIGDKKSVTNADFQTFYAEYVAGLAAAGADAIEVWNEENIDREWPQGQINPASYVSLLAKSYNAIKAANPNTIVIMGAPAPTGAEGAFGLDRVWNDDRYYQGLGAAGAGRYADCIGIHYNEGIVGPNQTSGDPRGDYPTRYFTTMLNRALRPFPGKKGCYTELGYLSPEGYPPLPGSFAWAANTTVEQQAAWLAGAASRAAQSGRVRLMIVFNVDFTFYGEDPQGGFAMIRPGGACPACDTLGAVMR